MLSPDEVNKAFGELVPTGTLRVGVVFAPAVSTFFVALDNAGLPWGPTVDLGKELARTLSAPIEFFVVPNSGELADAIERQAIDVAFMPVDDDRRKRVSFGPSYFLIESTGLVADNAPFTNAHDLNRAGVRVVGIANTTTIRNAARVLNEATVFPVTSVSEAMQKLSDGEADAIALSRDVLIGYQRAMPHTRLLEGNLHMTSVAIAVPKGRPHALQCVTAFLEDAKASGFIRHSFDKAGLHADNVAL